MVGINFFLAYYGVYFLNPQALFSSVGILLKIWGLIFFIIPSAYFYLDGVIISAYIWIKYMVSFHQHIILISIADKAILKSIDIFLCQLH